MHIEVFKGKGMQSWRWHFRNKGRVTADSEGFPSRANAIRASKAVVVAVVKADRYLYPPLIFTVKEESKTLTIITW